LTPSVASTHSLLATFLSLFALSLSCYFDLRERRIPDWITCSGTIAGILLWLSAGRFDVVLYVGCTFLAAYLLYRVGLWAGGDVKLFTALAALNPYSVEVFGRAVPFPLLLFILSVLLAFLLSFPFMLVKILLRGDLRKALLSGASRILVKAFSISVLTTGLGAPGLLFAFLPSPYDVFSALAVLLWNPSPAFLPSFALISLSAFFLRVLSMRVHVFRREKSVEELVEGDVPADFVTEDGRVIPFSWRTAVLVEAGKIPVRLSPLRAAGVSREDIEWLRSKGIRRIHVRTTMPFVPFVAAAYLFSIFPIFSGG